VLTRRPCTPRRAALESTAPRRPARKTAAVLLSQTGTG
jgi:hypothetical protein